MGVKPAQRIGLFGGAFDPPHDAHLALVQTALEQLGLDLVHVAPTGDAWHKSRPLSPATDRLAMCRLAFAGWERVQVDDRELQRTGPTYTIDTLSELHAQHPEAQLFLLIGADQALDFARWHRAQDILAQARVVIADRAGTATPWNASDPLPGLKLSRALGVQRLPLAAMAHSSSAIRARVATGQPVAGWVPASVARYIAGYHLYQKSDSMSETAVRKDIQKLQRAIVDGLEDVKAHDIRVFNTEHLTPLFERVIVATGKSNRQTKALAASVRDKVREAGFDKPRMEGEDNGEWIIIDCGTAVAHVMQPAIRQYYNLEEIWGDKPVRLRSAAAAPAARKAAAVKAAAPTKKVDTARVQPAKARRSADAPAATKKKSPVKPVGRAAPPAARKTTTGQSAGARAAVTKKAVAKKPAMKQAASSKKTAARSGR